MSGPILVASKDEVLLNTRADILQNAGYTAVRVDDLRIAESLARFHAIGTVMMDHTFTTDEQLNCIVALRMESSQVHILCLGEGVIQPEELLHECAIYDKPNENFEQVRVIPNAWFG